MEQRSRIRVTSLPSAQILRIMVSFARSIAIERSECTLFIQMFPFKPEVEYHLVFLWFIFFILVKNYFVFETIFETRKSTLRPIVITISSLLLKCACLRISNHGKISPTKTIQKCCRKQSATNILFMFYRFQFPMKHYQRNLTQKNGKRKRVVTKEW